MCYIYAGDGRCEEFEREDSVRDCGFFTPAGFKDQVAVSALANPSYQRSECPSELAAGPPTADTVSTVTATERRCHSMPLFP